MSNRYPRLLASYHLPQQNQEFTARICCLKNLERYYPGCIVGSRDETISRAVVCWRMAATRCYWGVSAGIKRTQHTTVVVAKDVIRPNYHKLTGIVVLRGVGDILQAMERG